MDEISDFSNLLGSLDGSVWDDGGGVDGSDGVFGLGSMGDGVDAFMATMGAAGDMLGLDSDMGLEGEGDVLADVPSDLDVESVTSSRSASFGGRSRGAKVLGDDGNLKDGAGSDEGSMAAARSSDLGGSKAGSSGSGVGGGAGGSGAGVNGGSKRKRQNLTPDERLKQNRDRNREHARNTRLRKKAFVEELKKTVQDLVAKREREVRQRRMHAARSREQHEVQLKVLSTFLNYRGVFMADRRKWSAIISPSFKMVLPLTRYRPFNEAQVNNNRRELGTLEALVEDVASLKRFATSILRGKAPLKGRASGGATFAFHVDSKDVIYKGDSLMALWSASSEGYAAYGAREFCCRGMAHVVFDKANKIETMELTWDSLGVSRSFGRVARALHLASEPDAMTSTGVPEMPARVESVPTSPPSDAPPRAVFDDDNGFGLEAGAGSDESSLAQEGLDVYHSMEIDLLRQLLEDVCADRVGSTILKRPSEDGNGIQRTHVRLMPFTMPEAVPGGPAQGDAGAAAGEAGAGEAQRKVAAEGASETVHFMGVLQDLPALAGVAAGLDDTDDGGLFDALGPRSSPARRSKRHRAPQALGDRIADHYDQLADDESGDDAMKTDDASRKKHLRRQKGEADPGLAPAERSDGLRARSPEVVADDGSESSRRLTRSTTRKV